MNVTPSCSSWGWATASDQSQPQSFFLYLSPSLVRSSRYAFRQLDYTEQQSAECSKRKNKSNLDRYYEQQLRYRNNNIVLAVNQKLTVPVFVYFHNQTVLRINIVGLSTLSVLAWRCIIGSRICSQTGISSRIFLYHSSHRKAIL